MKEVGLLEKESECAVAVKIIYNNVLSMLCHMFKLLASLQKQLVLPLAEVITGMIDNTWAWHLDKIRVHFCSKRRIYLLRHWKRLEALLSRLLCGSRGMAALLHSPSTGSVLPNEV